MYAIIQIDGAALHFYRSVTMAFGHSNFRCLRTWHTHKVTESIFIELFHTICFNKTTFYKQALLHYPHDIKTHCD